MTEHLSLPSWARDLVHTSRVGHLSTASSDGNPHVVPVCFAVVELSIVIAIDEKPKSGGRLRRLRNIEENPRAAFVIDHYDEDWTHLAWVLIRGAARVVSPGDGDHLPAIEMLLSKYPQYRSMRIADAELIALSCERTTIWRAAP